MPEVIWKAGPQSPFYGIDLANVADRLTRRNWSSKAIIRKSAGGPLWVWIERGDGPGVRRRYLVDVEGVEERRWDLQRDFAYLKEALAYANGRDDGALARETQPGRREDWPAHVTKEPLWTVVFQA
jgi:hypothetical protein